MKKVMLSGSVIMAMIMTSCGPTQKDAIKYNDELIAIQKSLTPVHEGFINQMDGHNPDSLKIMQGIFAEQTKSSLEASEKMQAFNEKTEYKDAAVEYFKALNNLAMNEGKMIADIMSKDSASVTEEDINKVTEYAGKFDSQYETMLKKVQAAQEAFAKEWKFEIKEN